MLLCVVANTWLEKSVTLSCDQYTTGCYSVWSQYKTECSPVWWLVNDWMLPFVVPSKYLNFPYVITSTCLTVTLWGCQSDWMLLCVLASTWLTVILCSDECRNKCYSVWWPVHDWLLLCVVTNAGMNVTLCCDQYMTKCTLSSDQYTTEVVISK
jgi:hypothetical protein